MQPRLAIRLLGAPQVLLDGKAVGKFRTAKAQALLYYLAATQQTHTRATLATLLWGDMAERNAYVNLSKTLSNLRDLLPAYLQIDRQFVTFGGEAPYWLDCALFQQGFAAWQKNADASALPPVVALYQDDFLAGFQVNGAPNFDGWQHVQREALRTSFLQGLTALAAYYTGQGNFTEAMACLRRLLSIAPWHEEAHRQLMWLLATTGQRSAALVQYDLCRQTLVEELAVGPAPETEELYARIRDGNREGRMGDPIGEQPPPVLPTPPHSPSPRDPTLIGRTEELARLHSLLHDPAGRLVMLVGPGGVGKTTLALACLADARAAFADGVYYVPLSGINQPADAVSDAALALLLVTMITDSLSLTLAGTESMQAQLLNFLRHKRLLLILDNFEQFVGATPLLSTLLHEAPDLHLLVTSRVALPSMVKVTRPVHIALHNLPVPPAGQVDNLTDLLTFASVALFAQCAQRIQPNFRLTQEKAQSVVAICRTVDGLPLALELATGWLHTLTCAEIAAELASGLTLLDTPSPSVAGQQRSIHAIFDYSWRLLSPAEQQCAAQLSVFQGSANRAAVQWVITSALPHLNSLMHKSILRRNGAGRYELHDLLHHYCAEKLTTLYEPGVVYTRHSIYYLTLLQEREHGIKQKQAQRVIQEMRLELDNLRQAWRWAVEQQNLTLLRRSLAGYSRFYMLIGLYAEASGTLAWTVDALRSHPTPAPAAQELQQLCSALLSCEAAFLNKQALYDHAIFVAQAAAQLARELNLPTSIAQALLNWGEAYWNQGRMAETQPLLTQVLVITNQAFLLDLKAQEIRADALALQGSIAVRLGKYLEAITCYKESLHIARALQDAYGESRALHSLGTTFRNQGRYGEARSYLEQGLQLSIQIGDLPSQSRSLNSLGDIAYYRGDYASAQRHFSEARAIALQIGDRRGESIAVTNLGIVARDVGEYSTGKTLFLQGLHLAQEIGFHRGEAWASVCLSLLSHQLNQDSLALEYGQQGLRIFAELGDDVGQAYAWTEIGHALVALYRLDEAATAYAQALALRQKLLQPHLELEVLAGLIRVDVARGASGEANQKAVRLSNYLAANPPLGVEEPIHIYWTCYNALYDRDLAQQILQQAHKLLAERVAALEDEQLQRIFLEQVTTHRAVADIWRARMLENRFTPLPQSS